MVQACHPSSLEAEVRSLRPTEFKANQGYIDRRGVYRPVLEHLVNMVTSLRFNLKLGGEEGKRQTGREGR